MLNFLNRLYFMRCKLIDDIFQTNNMIKSLRANQSAKNSTMIKSILTIVFGCILSTVASAQAEVIPDNLASTLASVVMTARSNFALLRGEKTDDANTEEYKTATSLTGCDKTYIQVNPFGSNYTQWIALYDFESKEKAVNMQFYNVWYNTIKSTPITVAGKKYSWTPIVDAKNPTGEDEGGGIFKSFIMITPLHGKQQLSLSLVLPPPGFDTGSGLTVEVHQVK